MYDYLVVGAGISGATFARLAAEHNQSVLVVDKEKYIGGLCSTFTDPSTGIIIHKFGPHIFHTSDKEVWDFVNRFDEFNQYVYSPLAEVDGKLYNLPINMNTIKQVFGITNPRDARMFIDELSVDVDPNNFEESCRSKIGDKLYDMFFKGYTEKQWHTKCTNLPPSLFNRQIVRFNYNNNYFNDLYQGIPSLGYSRMINNMLLHSNITVLTGTDYSLNSPLNSVAQRIVYTGCIDRLLEYSFGAIPYNSCEFHTYIFNTDNLQGSAVINHCDARRSYTRTIEHKFFNQHNKGFSSNKTILTYEVPKEYTPDTNKPLYPRYDGVDIYNKYIPVVPNNIILLGRLATYKYLNMDQAVKYAIDCYRRELIK